jgi:gliding motility-associated-like protein
MIKFSTSLKPQDLLPLFYSMLLHRLTFLCVWLIVGSTMLNAQNNCGCINCPQPIPDADTLISTLNIKGAINNNLAATGQGVCKVCIKFAHGFVSDLKIVLISPNGQAITLIAPISQQGYTPLSRWDVCFLPCSVVPNPDPGFPAQWSNSGWGAFGNYTGSYHPYQGACLEDFNAGPVNGNWKLMVIDGDDFQVGTLQDWTIEFCDPNGLDCIRCEANAGSLASYSAVTACRGTAPLRMTIPPVYTAASPMPSGAFYGYSYLVARNDTIIRIQPTTDYRNLPAGNYTVCGMSYRLTDAAKIPTPNNSLTLTQLKNQLSAAPPLFCGKITTTCIPITVLPTFVRNISASACGFYEFNGTKLFNSGNYQGKWTSKNGCDSIVNLALTINQPKIVNRNANTCQGKPYLLGKKLLTTSGIYRDTSRALTTGCDSITFLNLLVFDAPSYNDFKTICEGDSIRFAQKFVKKEGVYRDTITTLLGCDSIVVLDLKLKKGSVKLIDTTVCEGTCFQFQNINYCKSGIYDIKLNITSSNGCDSIIRIKLNVFPHLKDTLRRQICQGDTVRIGKNKYYQTGNYFDLLKSKNGCDSASIWSFIEVKNVITVNLKINICQGESFSFDGKTYTSSTTQIANNKSKNGCDSISNLTLIVHPKYNQNKIFYVCFGDTLTIGKNKYFKSGFYKDTLLTRWGCDSIIQSEIITLPKLETYLTQQLCEPSVIVVGNKVYSKSGIYRDTISSINGCDSIIRLDLTVYPKIDITINESYCFGKNPADFPKTGIYKKVFTTHLGKCDSNVTYNVLIYPEIKKVINAQICTGSSYSIGSQTFATEGQFIVKDTSEITGCDSIIILNISFTDQIKNNLIRQLCEGESIIVGTKKYEKTVKDTILLQSFAGCDSIVYLDLTVNPRHLIELSYTLCEGECANVGGINYCKSGTTILEHKNRFGCDSVTIIKITLKKQPITELTATLCFGEFYQLGKKKITISGFHQDTLTAANGCDSVLSLDLTIRPLQKDSSFQLLCAESNQATGIFTTKLTSSKGCDSIIIRQLEKIPKKETNIKKRLCRGENIVVNNKIFTTSGTFIEVIKNVGILQCDSTVTLELNVIDSVLVYQKDTICNNQPYFHHGKPINQPTQLKERYSLLGVCDSIFNLEVTIKSCVVNIEAKTNAIDCNQNNGGAILINGLDSSFLVFSYAWRSIMGNFSTPTTLKGNQKDTISNLAAGEYEVKFWTESGWITTQKLIIEDITPLKAQLKASDYQGFGVSCDGKNDGRLEVLVTSGTPPYQYEWTGGFSTERREQVAAGKYQVTITDAQKCKIVLDTALTSPPPLKMQISSKNLICFQSNDGIIQVDSVFNGTAPYQYSIDARPYSTSNKFDQQNASLHLVLVKDAKGCIGDTIISLTEPDKIVVNLGNDTTIIAGETVKIQATVNLLPSQIQKLVWNDFITPTCATCLEVSVSPSQNTGYLLTIYDKNNCIGRDEMYIFVKDLPLFVPNTFSPNDDGINDGFTIYGDDTIFKISSLRIFNRWGDMVFEALNFAPNDYTKGWNGKYKNVEQQSAVYIYIAEIEFKDRRKQSLKGEVLLIR